MFVESDAPATSATFVSEADERFDEMPLRAWRTRWLWLAALVIVAVIAWSLIPVGGTEDEEIPADTVTMAATS